MKSVIFKKENGVVTKMQNNRSNRKQLIEERGNKEHICWHYCANSTPKKCEKVFDIKKKAIAYYKFIRDGYQIIDEKGQLESFVVTNCDNYKEVVKRKKWERK